MNTNPFVIERTYNAHIVKVWKAITNKENMKKWYFDISEFKPEVGFEFQFLGGDSEGKKYLHICQITEVVIGKKLAYTWRYSDYKGSSVVTFELFDEGEKTRLKLTHEGLETFPTDDPAFARTSFAEGWTYIIGKSLKEFAEVSTVSD